MGVWEEGQWKWVWGWRRGFFQWERELFYNFQTTFNSFVLSNGDQDKWVWKQDHSDVYTVHSAYKMLKDSDAGNDDQFFKKLLQTGAHLKVITFAWQAVQGRIPTMKNLALRNIIPWSKSVCKGCSKLMETKSHLFFECDFFLALWMECLKWWGVSSALQNCYRSHFLQFTGLITSPVSTLRMWQIIWCAVIWVIWTSCNRLIFKEVKTKQQNLMELVKIKSWHWLSARNKSFKHSLLCWFLNPHGCLGLSGC